MSAKKAMGSQMETLIAKLGGSPPEHPVPSKYVTAEQMERAINAAGGAPTNNPVPSKYATAEQMERLIDAVSAGSGSGGGGDITVVSLTARENKQYTAPSGKAYNPVTVDVPSPSLQSKTVTPSKSSQNVAPDAGYDALSGVTVNPIPAQYIVPSGSLDIAENGTYDVTDKAGVVVNVPTGGGATLLASYTVPENVSIVSIDYTSAMDGYDAYIMEIEGTAAERTLYICPQLNTTNLKAYNGETNAGGAFHKKYWVAPFTLFSSVDIDGYMVVVKKGSQNSVTGAITNFVFASFYSDAYFAVGTVAKIWGVTS